MKNLRKPLSLALLIAALCICISCSDDDTDASVQTAEETITWPVTMKTSNGVTTFVFAKDGTFSYTETITPKSGTGTYTYSGGAITKTGTTINVAFSNGINNTLTVTSTGSLSSSSM